MAAVPVETIKSDSIYVKEIIRDTVIVPSIEKEYIQKTVEDTTSVLTLSFSRSVASIINNRLYHSLEQNEQNIPVKIPYKDKLVEKIKKEYVEVPVETPVPIRDNIFWYSIILNIILVGGLLYRILRFFKL